jgi:hypothetical protein
VHEENKSRRRPWWFYVALTVGAVLIGSLVVFVAMSMFFMLIYGW